MISWIHIISFPLVWVAINVLPVSVHSFGLEFQMVNRWNHSEQQQPLNALTSHITVYAEYCLTWTKAARNTLPSTILQFLCRTVLASQLDNSRSVDSPDEEFQPRRLLLIGKLFKFVPTQAQLSIYLSASRLGVCPGAVPPDAQGSTTFSNVWIDIAMRNKGPWSARRSSNESELGRGDVQLRWWCGAAVQIYSIFQ
jgi:hypothetical protein